MKTTTSRAVAATTGAVALVLSMGACGMLPGSGEDDPATAGEDGGNGEEPELGPLDQYFEEIYGGDAGQETSNAQQMQVEEITAECMAEQGFEYIPVDWSSMGGGMEVMPDELDVEWGTLEFAEKYGYGATTDPWGTGEQPVPEGEEEFVDPNQVVVDAMSDTEREAYYAALYGEPPTEEEMAEGGEFEYDWTTAGCSGKAQHEVYETVDGVEEDEFAALQEEMNSMYEASMQDPRLTGLNDEWSTCMADAGYPGMAAVGDGETTIYDEVNALYEDAYADVDPSVEMTEEDYAAIEAAVVEARKEITPREIEMAVADFTCREDISYQEIQQEVNFEHQQEFVDAHKDELDAWVESMASSGAKG
jgi:hypothetical protein